MTSAPTAHASSSTVSSTRAPNDTPTPLPTHAAIAKTGIDVVDRTIDAVARRDANALGDLLVVSSVACVTDPRGKIPALECVAGEPDGTVHDEVLHGSCQTGWATPAAARAVMRDYAAAGLSLYAVAESSTDPGYYKALFLDLSGKGGGVAFHLTSAGIDSYGGGCGAAPADQFAGWGRFVVAPP